MKRLLRKIKKVLKNKDGFGVAEILGIAAAIIIAAFVLIPGIGEFADLVIEAMKDWFNDTVTDKIFPETFS